MKRSNRLLVLFGLIFALVGGGLAFVVASGGSGTGTGVVPSATLAAEPMTTVVTAKQDINPRDPVVLERRPRRLAGG